LSPELNEIKWTFEPENLPINKMEITMRRTMETGTEPSRRRPVWMLLAIAANLAPLGMATLLSSPLEARVDSVLEGLHAAAMRLFPNDSLSELPGAYYATLHAAYYVAPTLLMLLLLKFTRAQFGLALNRLTLALLVLGATGLVLRLGGNLYYHAVQGATHWSAGLEQVLDGMVFAGLWYRWIQPRAERVQVMQHLLAEI
jgi:hypothetical protein